MGTFLAPLSISILIRRTQKISQSIPNPHQVMQLTLD